MQLLCHKAALCLSVLHQHFSSISTEAAPPPPKGKSLFLLLYCNASCIPQISVLHVVFNYSNGNGCGKYIVLSVGLNLCFSFPDKRCILFANYQFRRGTERLVEHRSPRQHLLQCPHLQYYKQLQQLQRLLHRLLQRPTLQ